MASSPASHAVTLITRQDCHLCADASATMIRLAAELGFAYAERDVDTDAGLTDRERFEFGDHVPVILIDGKEHGYWRVEEPRFRRALNR
jgi:glutaredoxin